MHSFLPAFLLTFSVPGLSLSKQQQPTTKRFRSVSHLIILKIFEEILEKSIEKIRKKSGFQASAVSAFKVCPKSRSQKVISWQKVMMV